MHACLLVVLPLVVLAQQADRDRTDTLARRATDRMRALQQEADSLAAREKTLLGELRKLEIDRQLRIEEVRQIDAEASAVERDLAATTGRLAVLQAEDRAARPELEARLVEMYKLGGARYLRLLLSTADTRRIGQASRTIAVLARLDRDRIVAHQRTVAELTAARATLEERGRRLVALRAEARRAQADLDQAVRARDAMIREIDRQRDLNAQLAGELQTAHRQLQITLRQLAGGGAVEPAALPLRPFRGDLPWPLAGTVRRRFGGAGRQSPLSNGIEIGAPDGRTVAAIHDGVVLFAGAFTGFGNLVILGHGPQTFSLYGNLLDVATVKGARVDAGQAIGTVGAPAIGPAGLYFELRIDGRPVDPLQWLRKR